jgi:hypothetical protein
MVKALGRDPDRLEDGLGIRFVNCYASLRLSPCLRDDSNPYKIAPAGIRTRVADSKGRHTLGIFWFDRTILPGLAGASPVGN